MSHIEKLIEVVNTQIEVTLALRDQLDGRKGTLEKLVDSLGKTADILKQLTDRVSQLEDRVDYLEESQF